MRVEVPKRRKGLKSLLPLSALHHVRTQQERGIYKPGRGCSSNTGSASTLVVNFSASRAVRYKCLLFKSGYGILLQPVDLNKKKKIQINSLKEILFHIYKQ